MAGSALLVLGVLLAAPAHHDYDDCEARFVAAPGAEAYQLSPLHRGELGRVRLYAILSHQRAAAHRDHGAAFWKLEVRGPDELDVLVHEARGSGRIADERGKALAEGAWAGTDAQGVPVPAGLYRYTFRARFLPDGVTPGSRPLRYEDLDGVAGVDEADATTREVVVDYSLSEKTAREIRLSLAASVCQSHQNAPLESGFGFNFYYGSTHSHSNWSDGGQSTSSCSSGASYGSGTYDPASVFSFARNTAGLDYWVVNEHNHLIQDAVANNWAPVTEAKVRQRYQDGLAAAQAATADGSFVAVYGMEWGVTTNTDQGHVTLLETPVLFGWESCTNCNGTAPECTPGVNCYFDVFTPKRYGYLQLYARSVENPSPAGPLGIFAHPSSGNFDNFAFDQNADAAMQGVAVRSGLAFSTASDCADANVGATDYSARWRAALNVGFHVGPIADHDAHCINYGVAIPNRTVYLLPNGAAPVLTKAALLAAHKARHFFATEDSNAQLVFATSDGAHVMGDAFSTGTSVTLRAAAYDPDGETLSRIELWRGQIGGGALTAAYRTFSGAQGFEATETLASGTYYYFVHAVQADGHELWSSPMWITFGAQAPDTTPPTTPGGVTATAVSAAAIDVGWTASTDDVGVTGYRISRDGVLVATAAGSATSYRDGGLAAFTTYSYVVTAVDAAGNASAPSAVASATTSGDAPPSAPANLTATAVSASQIDLAWTAAVDDVGVAAYRVYRDGSLHATAAGTAFSDASLGADETHSYAVTAVDGAGQESAPSNTATATTPCSAAVTFKSWTGKTKTVTVRATSSRQPSAVLTASADGAALGTMTFVASGGYYEVRKQLSRRPACVAVSADCGGTAQSCF